MPAERDIQAAIRLKLGARPDVRLWRNNVGEADFHDPSTGRTYRVKYGLAPGSSDLIGFRTREIGGVLVAQFVAIECKATRGRQPTEEQRMFLELVRARGGISGVARSVEDAEELLRAT